MNQRGKEKVFRIHEPKELSPKPTIYERRAAELMMGFLKSNIEFVIRGSATTPDILATDLSQFWEIKNIRGNSTNTIHNNLKNIDRQSENIIITLFRTKMTPKKAEAEVRKHLERATRIKRAVIITKSGEILVIRR